MLSLGWRDALWGKRVLSKNMTQWPQPGLLNPKPSALPIRPQHLPYITGNELNEDANKEILEKPPFLVDYT